MTILHEEAVTTCHDGVWQMRVLATRALIPQRIDGRLRWLAPHYALQFAPPNWPDQWQTVGRTAANWERWTAQRGVTAPEGVMSMRHELGRPQQVDVR